MTIQMKNTGKRIDLIANRKPQSQKVLYELKDQLKKHHFILNDTNPDIVISIGGDGMLLSAFHKYENQLDKVRFIGTWDFTQIIAILSWTSWLPISNWILVPRFPILF